MPSKHLSMLQFVSLIVLYSAQFMLITKISIKNPVFTIMIMMALMVLGLLSIQKMGVDEFPDVQFPNVIVQTSYPGASPESVESEVSKKIEEAINSIAGLKDISSRSYEGVSVVIAQFNLSEDISRAANDVRDKVNAIKPTLNKDVKDPIISKFDPADRAIASYSIQNPNLSFQELSTFAEQKLKKRLETIKGVGQVNIVGASQRQLQININVEKLRNYNVGFDEVLQSLQANNIDIPSGNIKDGFLEKGLQIKGKLKSTTEFENIIVSKQANGNIYLKQIADVIDGEEEVSSLSLLDGKRTIAIEILKAQKENTIQVSNDIVKRIEDIGPELPQGTVIKIIRDSSNSIKLNVKNVQNTILEGAILTILIVFLFLNSWRSTIITGLTLPISLISTFAFMYFLGFTVNIITLMALSISVGLLIDDAIVVRENIMRHVAMGKNHVQAALDGTKEISLAVLATTLSIVAVFLPVGLMGGIIGRFFHQFGITIVVAVLISMFVSFTLDPMLSAIWPEPKNKKSNFISRWVDKFDHKMEDLGGFYQKILAWSLKRRALTIIFAVIVFVCSLMIPKFLGKEFVPSPDFGELSISFNTPDGSSLEHTKSKALQIEQIIKTIPHVKSTYTTINTGFSKGKNYANIYAKLTSKKDRKISLSEIANIIRQKTNTVGGVLISNIGPINNFAEKPILISLRGADLSELEKISAIAVQKLSKIKGITDLTTSLKDSKPIMQVKIKDSEAADFGLNLNNIGNVLRPLFAGQELNTWRDKNEDYTVLVQISPEQRTISNLKSVSMLNLNNNSSVNGSNSNRYSNEKLLNIEQVVDISSELTPNQINRKNLSREVSISANNFIRSTGEIGVDIKQALSTIKLPPGYEFITEGSNKDMNESGMYAMQALMLAIIFIYMVIASQFGSFTQPIAIMASLPMTLIGAFLALLFFNSTLNLFSIIGFIMLMGLVTKNAILLVDYANRMRLENHNRTQALLIAAKVRLRPILMTTLAMIFGMLPLALGLSEGSEQRAPMGQAVIGGVITSSLLTLVLVPVVYSLLDDLVVKIKNIGKNKK